jgi:hypothetical protein
VLYEKILWADEVYWTDYHPNGAMTLRAVGDVSGAQPATEAVGRFGETAEVLRTETNWDGNVLRLTLRWRSLSPARPTDTIFIHVFNTDGELVGQGDGDSLNGLLPPGAWRPGDVIVDRRTIVSAAPLSPEEHYRLTVGMYDRATGERYPAFEADGGQAPDGELEVSPNEAVSPARRNAHP